MHLPLVECECECRKNLELEIDESSRLINGKSQEIALLTEKLELQESLRKADVNSFESQIKDNADRCQENANNLYILLHSVDDLEKGMKTVQHQLGKQAPSRIGCNFCGKVFSKDSDLKSHIISEHRF